MKTYLITGGAGFIGSHIATALVQRGDQVRVLDNLSTGHRRNLAHLDGQIEFIEDDICCEESVQKAVEGVDFVYHQAALASVPRSLKAPKATHEACVTGVLNLLIAAKDAGVKRFIYAASSSAYGNQPFSSKRETDVPAPLSPYATAKLAGEYYCRSFYESFGLETVALRYFNVFGPRQDPSSEYSAVIPKFIKIMSEGRQPTIYGDGLQSRDFTFVANVVSGNLLAAEADGVAGKVFNVACGTQFSLLELVARLNELLGTQVEPILGDRRPGDVYSSLADITAARATMGYEPLVGFREGLSETIAWARDQHA